MPLGVEPSQQISIHALREEGDDLRAAMLVRNLYFYPRPRVGGPRPRCRLVGPNPFFLPPPAGRWATPPKTSAASDHLISIHALREEGDSKNRDKISIFK